MTEPRDEIDNWLGTEVEPLAPPPGAFERVHRRARRRKRNQALFAAAGAVVVIAGATLVPTLGAGLFTSSNGAPPPAAAGSATPGSAAPSTPAARSPSSSPAPPASTPASSVTESPSGTGLSATTSGAGPPASFQPSSVTMIGHGIGAVIGQAGTPGHCGPPVASDCTSLAGTSDYGKTWYGVSAPVTGVPAGFTGTSQLRFLNLEDGWAFGPALWVTSNGGRHWTQESTGGRLVTGLETAGTRAFAVLASCQNAGSAYAADCSTFSLWSSAAGSTSFQPVTLGIPQGVSAGAMGTAGQASSASVVIRGNAANAQAGTGYLLAPSGDILSGSVGGGPWTYLGKAPCTPGTAAYGGAPLGAQLTPGGAGLLLDCATGNGSGALGGVSTQPKQLWQSASGRQWTKMSTPPASGVASSLAATSSGQVVLATTAGIAYSADGTTWRPATVTGGVPPGGFSYVGMTSDTQGVALPADASLGEVFVSSDGGQTWTPSRISG